MDPEAVPENVNPELSLGDIWKYSGLLMQVVSALAGLKATPVGGTVDLPVIDSYLPGGLGEWEFDIKGTRKK